MPRFDVHVYPYGLGYPNEDSAYSLGEIVANDKNEVLNLLNAPLENGQKGELFVPAHYEVDVKLIS